MARTRRTKRSKLQVETVADYETIPSEVQTDDQPSKLPIELLESILSRLSLRDNIRASSVCRLWQAAAVSVRRGSRSPWLMRPPKSGDTYEFYDPSQRKVYSLDFPELQGCRICYARDGWLLLSKPTTAQVFFFCPYSREVINVPNMDVQFQAVAFSSAPTSSSCIVFTAYHFTLLRVVICTCRPGAAQWTIDSYRSSLPFVTLGGNKLVFCNGAFYSLSNSGWLGIFDPEKKTWSANSVPPPNLPASFSGNAASSERRYMAEHDEDVFVVYTVSSAKPVVYKLDRTESVWTETKTFGESGGAFFASSLSCVVRTGLDETRRRNNVYFPQLVSSGKRCCLYSLDNCRYYPRLHTYDWWRTRFRSVWVDPPRDLSIFRNRKKN